MSNGPDSLSMFPETNDPSIRELVRSLAKELATALRNEIVSHGQSRYSSPEHQIGYTEAEAARVLGIPQYSLRDARLAGYISPAKIGHAGCILARCSANSSPNPARNNNLAAQ